MPSLPSHGKPRSSLSWRSRASVLVSPILAAGLYELSRRTERGEPSRFVDSLAVFVRGGEGLALFGLLITLLWVAWERFSAIMFSSCCRRRPG